jgi:hypothetical protein
MESRDLEAQALAQWALANPNDAAKVWRVLCLNPGGGRNVYLPLLPSTDVDRQCSVASPLVA